MHGCVCVCVGGVCVRLYVGVQMKARGLSAEVFTVMDTRTLSTCSGGGGGTGVVQGLKVERRCALPQM